MKNILRKIFYILLAVCVLGGGAYSLSLSKQAESAYAENTSPQEISNDNLPEYFGIKETNGGNLISSNIFAFTSGAELSLSLKKNGSFNAGTNEIYSYVYYPDREVHEENTDISHFYFYQVSSLSLTVNGERTNLNKQNFVTEAIGLSFTNYNAITLESFEILFNEDGGDSAIKITDSGNNVVEGVYTLNLQIILFECFDGTNDASETQFADEKIVDIDYNFYVVDKSHYLTNSMPNVTREAFDTEILASTSPVYDYYLYSNYSSEGIVSNRIPYIEYDYTRYDLQIDKTLSVSAYTQNLLYDVDTWMITSAGDDIVYVRQDAMNHTAKVYFHNVGNYTVTFNDILLKEIGGNLEKHNLAGLSNQTKKYQIYVYGYQANYTDMDKTPDANNIRPVSELKTFDFDGGLFAQSADITSAFLNSNPAYSQENYGTSILIGNVANYINTNELKPVKTNQTPIKFTENAKLGKTADALSYIYTTNNLSGYEETEYELDGQKLYRKRFTGQAEGATGTYIYIIAYSFDDFRSSPSTMAPDKYFRQAFYFELNKELPTITIKTESNKNISNYVNENVLVYDTTKIQTPYNKDVQIKVFARDFSGNFLSSFGGAQGINYTSLLENEDDDHITLTQNAKYTIRLYFENEIKGTTISYNSDTKKIREVPFAIDKTPIENIRGVNVAEVLNSTDYSVVSTIENFSTNQNFVLSWDRKASGASTTAYYRYFKIRDFQYYSPSNDAYLSGVLQQMIGTNKTIPVNHTLDMSTENNNWNMYVGNADEQIRNGFVSSEYVFTDGGLYLVDVFDEAGNHSYDVFLLDYTSPLFALSNEYRTSYSLPNNACFISNPSILHWGKYKGFYISNFNDLYTSYTKETIDESLLEGEDFYLNHDGEFVREIYNTMFDKLKATGLFDFLVCNIPSTDTEVDNYASLYLKIPISSTYWYLNANNNYERRITTSYDENIGVENELTYRVLIRDESNTKLVPNIADNTALQHYTQYPSASQRITVSFDSSNFAIFYTENGERQFFYSNNVIEDRDSSSKTTFFNPTSKEAAFKLAFNPTTQISGATAKIQVQDVVIRYYEYVRRTEEINGVLYSFLELSENPVEIPLYSYNNEDNTNEVVETIKLNIDGYTAAGKYVITRTYKTGDGFTYNENDFLTRTFVFYVDRNDVVTNPDLVTDEIDGRNVSHLESLVGGDIFIAMYDSRDYADLVVTFPNSFEGNSKGSSLYNSGIPRTVLTTNKLPVSLYIPQYKYTKSVQKVEGVDGYYFVVNGNNSMNQYYDTPSTRLITEYLLYAELYKANFTNGFETSRSLIARTSTSATPSATSIQTDGHGFLNFYRTSNNARLYHLDEAGTYYVTIYQGYLIGENVQSLTFTFDIQKSDPNFEITTTSGTELGKVGNNYYTNQSIVSLIWDASNSEYITDIDPDAITFETSTGIPYDPSEIWIQSPTLSNNTYVSQVSLEKLGVYSHGASVKITMQYKNHNSQFYNKVSKTVYVDLSAPASTLNSLLAKSIDGSNLSGLNASSLRTFYTADMQETTNPQLTSYNISNSTGTFAFYSYPVNSNFLDTLRTSADYYKTYIRKFEGTKYQTGEQQETSPADFLISNFTEISRATIEAGNYYEIVETDLAQNMTIYSVYVTSYDNTEEKIFSYKNAANEEFAYTVENYNETKAHAGANHNIYARTGFRLQEIDYFGDEWSQFTLKKVDETGATTTYYLMLSPWDKTHAFSIVNGEVTSFEISSLIDGSINGPKKNSIAFKNRITGTVETFYINTRNVDLNARLTNVQEREYITFDSPTDEQINSTTSASVYLTSLKIVANDNIYYDQTNRLGYAAGWLSNDNVGVTLNAGNTITFELSQSLGFVPNTKITYIYTTNYNIEYTEIHLYRETIIPKEITSRNDIYAYRSSNGTLIYITKNGFEYHFNQNKYKVFVYDYENGERSVEQTTNADIAKTTSTNGVVTYTLNQKVEAGEEPYYDSTYVLEIWDVNEVNDDGTAKEDEYRPVKYVYVTLYDKLPLKNKSATAANEDGQFKLLDASRNNITERITESLSSDEAGYFSEITLMYAQDETFIPVKYMVSMDKIDWEEVASGTIFKNETDQIQKYYLKIWYDTTFLANEFGSAAYVFGLVDPNQIYEFNLSSLTSTFWIEKTVNNVTTVLQKNGTIYKAQNGTQYSNHYVVNLPHTNWESVVIKTNREQDIIATKLEEMQDSETVMSDLWIITNSHSTIANLPKFTTYVVITYIPTSENFVGEFRTYDESGRISETEELLSLDRKSFIITNDYSTISRVELQWTKYNGIEYNEINIAMTKDGVSLKPTVFTRKVEREDKTYYYNYCYITNSGKYIISLYDNAGNIQKFKYGVAGQTDKFTFIFLKDVPFNVTYTNPNTGLTETSFPIKQAVYNGTVTLELDGDKSTRESLYKANPVITVYRNGALLGQDDYETKEEGGRIKFVFTQPGFYEYYFTADSRELDTQIRRERYQFTIMNANEYRYSYIFNKYSNYYVEKVIKNGKDITSRLLKTLNYETITIGQNKYLVELQLNSLDEKTGSGTYLITINSNNKFFQNSTFPTSWTYQVVIQVGTAPINISVAEGKSITNAVKVTYNAANIYQEMGECTVQIVKYIRGKSHSVYKQEIDATSTGVLSTQIDRQEYGSYFVQIVSPSNTLLYSYKINKKEPMNAASILAIVGSVVLFVAIVIIVYRLRKKISVK